MNQRNLLKSLRSFNISEIILKCRDLKSVHQFLGLGNPLADPNKLVLQRIILYSQNKYNCKETK